MYSRNSNGAVSKTTVIIVVYSGCCDLCFETKNLPPVTMNKSHSAVDLTRWQALLWLRMSPYFKTCLQQLL